MSSKRFLQFFKNLPLQLAFLWLLWSHAIASLILGTLLVIRHSIIFIFTIFSLGMQKVKDPNVKVMRVRMQREVTMIREKDGHLAPDHTPSCKNIYERCQTLPTLMPSLKLKFSRSQQISLRQTSNLLLNGKFQSVCLTDRFFPIQLVTHYSPGTAHTPPYRHKPGRNTEICWSD